jgi:hypothetical protein
LDDIVVGRNTALGATIHGDLSGNTGQWGIKYTQWQAANHYDHIHVSVFRAFTM